MTCLLHALLFTLQNDKQAKALFQVVVSFAPKGMAFAPNEAAVLDELNANTLEGIISVAQVRVINANSHLLLAAAL